MSSPEFQQQLQKAQEFRRNEAKTLFILRKDGLKTEAQEYLHSLRQEDVYIEASQMVRYTRWENLGRRIPEFTQEQWKETGQVLSGVNNGVKAGLFLEIAQNTTPNTYMPTDSIIERFKGIFSGTDFLSALSEHKSHIARQIIDYCQKSLCNVGLLAEAYEIDNLGIQNLVGFGVTEQGRKIGIPVALSILWYENKIHESLYPILGQTASSSPSEVRAPLVRTRTLNYMVHHPYEVREADLVTALGIGAGNVYNDLGYLKDYGLVNYTAVTPNTGKTQVRYRKVESKNPADAGYLYSYHSSPLQNQIVEILKDNIGLISAADIFERFPDELKQNWQEKVLKSRVSVILSHLSTQGYLSRVDGFKGGKKLSDVSITSKGRCLYLWLVYPILLSTERALSENYLSHIEETNNNLALYAQNSAELYYPYSISSRKRKSRENKLQVLKIFQNNPDSLFTVQVLSGKMGLSQATIRKYLKPQITGSDEMIFYLDKKMVLAIQREQINGVWYFRFKSLENIKKD